MNVNRNYENGTFTLTQQKFNLIPEDDEQSAEVSWSIPFDYFTVYGDAPAPVPPAISNGYFFRNYVSLTMAPIQTVTPSDLIILNHRQTGFYRVNYDNDNWNLIINELAEGDYRKIPVLNRAQMIDDTFNLARGNKLSYSTPLRLIEYLKNEIDYIPWIAAMNALSHINRFYVNSEYYGHFKVISS